MTGFIHQINTFFNPGSTVQASKELVPSIKSLEHSLVNIDVKSANALQELVDLLLKVSLRLHDKPVRNAIEKTCESLQTHIDSKNSGDAAASLLMLSNVLNLIEQPDLQALLAPLQQKLLQVKPTANQAVVNAA